LLKKYHKLWVFGDSHSTPGVCVDNCDSFWGLTAKHLQVDTIINCSRPAMSFDSVCQILVGEQHQYNFSEDFFLIGIPPLERITAFDNFKDTPMCANIFDTATWENYKTLIHSHHGLVNYQYKDLDKILLLLSDRSWLETQVLRQIFLLTQWLDKNLANYIFVNLSKNLEVNNVWGPTNFILEYCLNHKRLKIFDGSLYDVNLNLNEPADYKSYGWFGHHGAAGNKHFFEETIKNNLC
jgi:hypothetical protein